VSGGFAADRLEVRVCSDSDCTDVGQGPDDVGEYDNLLFSINPDLAADGYPTTWTEFTVSDLPTSGYGRLAFRYYVTDAMSGGNGSIVGIDRVTIDDGNTSPSGPTVTPAFDPESIGLSDTSTLSFAFANAGLSDATTTQEFDRSLPPGVSVASGALPQTDCANGTVMMSPSQRTIELAAGAVIPTGGSCSVSVLVSPTTQGVSSASVFPGALQTDAGPNDNTATSNLIVLGPGGGPNGIFESPAPIHIIPETVTGTSLNLVSSIFDDTGPLVGDFDLNFWNSVKGLDVWPIPTYGARIAVNGFALASFQPGDVVGPTSTFSDNTYHDSSALADGGDHYVGFVFNCDGRLANPVAGGVCYGYVHVTTTFNPDEGFGAFPADLVNWAFDGDGNPITIQAGGGEGHDPAATIAPTSLTFTVPADQVATQTFTITNSTNSNPLTFDLFGQFGGTMELQPVADSSDIVSHVLKARAGSSHPDIDTRQPRPLVGGVGLSKTASAPWAPRGSDGTLLFQLDDGSYDYWLGIAVTPLPPDSLEYGAVWINRYRVPDGVGAFTINSISIEWPSHGGNLIGLQPNLVAYYDADGDGDPTNAVRLGTDTLVTIGSLDTFETYPVNFQVPGQGDVYIGFVDQWALIPGGYSPPYEPVAVDSMDNLRGHHSADRSYVSFGSDADVPTDINNLANNFVTDIIDHSGTGGNFLIRATGTGGGTPTSCSGPQVWWMTATPNSGILGAGHEADITVTVNPLAEGLRPGQYTAELCYESNDPTKPVISVPISVTVTPGAPPCPPDRMLANGFDDDSAGCGSSPGAQVVLDQDEFMADISPDFYLNTFDEISPGMLDDLTYTQGDFTYIVSASEPFDPDTGLGGLYGGNADVTVNYSRDKMVLTFTSGNITAVGANFWASDINEIPTDTAIIVEDADGRGTTIDVSSPDTFVGFVSSVPIVSLTIDAPEQGAEFWPTLDNLVVGNVLANKR
jgi:hypothetical protein